jgi:hypothetical protein
MTPDDAARRQTKITGDEKQVIQKRGLISQELRTQRPIFKMNRESRWIVLTANVLLIE